MKLFTLALALTAAVTLHATAQVHVIDLHSPYAQGATPPVTAYDQELKAQCFNYFAAYHSAVQAAIEAKQERKALEFRLCVAEAKLDKYKNSCFDFYPEYQDSTLTKALGYPLK